MPEAKVGGVTLYYEIHGKGFPLVLVHGYCGTVQTWRHQVEAISREYQLITFDLPGHGKSATPLDSALYSADAVVEDIRQLLDVLGIKKAVVGGHSLGGYIALRSQLIHPERVASLILIGAGPGFRNPVQRDAWNRRCLDYAEVLEKEGLQAFGVRFPGHINDSMGHNAVGLAKAGRFTMTQKDPRVTEHLGSIEVPTLITVGERDTVNHRPAEYMAKAIPGARHVIVPDAGHAACLDNPVAFNALVLDFLRKSSL